MLNIQNFELALSICKKKQEIPAFRVRGQAEPSWLRFWWNPWGEWAIQGADGRRWTEDEAESLLASLPTQSLAPCQPVLPRIGLTGPAV